MYYKVIMEEQNTKYIIHIYKIVSKKDTIRVFISSTKVKVKSLLPFFLSDSKKSNTKNVLYNWITKYPDYSFSCKKIKSYPVSNEKEQEEKEQYWIDKYKKDGYNVLHNILDTIVHKSKTIENTEKIYVCFQGVSINEIMLKYKNNIITFSKEPFISNKSLEYKTNTIPKPPPPPMNTMKPRTIQSSLSKSTENNKKQKSNTTISATSSTTSSTGYLDELKNILQLRKSSGKSIAELQNKKTFVKKKIKKIILSPTNNKKKCGQQVLDELKQKIKKIV